MMKDKNDQNNEPASKFSLPSGNLLPHSAAEEKSNQVKVAEPKPCTSHCDKVAGYQLLVGETLAQTNCPCSQLLKEFDKEKDEQKNAYLKLKQRKKKKQK